MEAESKSSKLTLDEIRLAAAGLIAKHQGYLRLIFFNYPDNIQTALYNEEIGWGPILLGPPSEHKKIRSWENCQDLFTAALRCGFPYHQKICGTKSHEGGLLVCEIEGDCLVMRNQEAWISKHSLTDDEAKVLYDLLQLKKLDRESQDYTPDNIVKLLQ